LYELNIELAISCALFPNLANSTAPAKIWPEPVVGLILKVAGFRPELYSGQALLRILFRTSLPVFLQFHKPWKIVGIAMMKAAEYYCIIEVLSKPHGSVRQQ